MADSQVKEINEADLKDLKCRMKLIEEADPEQYQNEFALRRYLRAFKTTDEAFKVCSYSSFVNFLNLSSYFYVGNFENQQMEERIRRE